MENGFVYILINATMPGLVKIGQSRRSSIDRLVELSGETGVPTPFSLVWEECVSQCEKAESEIHERLAKYRVNAKREFLFHFA